jgi:ubiquinol-cytochrome c reductase iron-sulfur subunit
VSDRAVERWVAGCFLAAAACAVGFVVGYVVDSGPQVTGGLLGAACALVALGLLLWSARLLPDGTFVEEREPPAPTEADQDAVTEALGRGAVSRTGLLRRTFLLAGVSLAAAVVVPLRSLLSPGSTHPDRALSETDWRRGRRMQTREGDLVRAGDLQIGDTLTVFPEGFPEADDSATVLVRVDPRELRRPTARGAAGAVDGILAFSKLCTHAGCPVGLYEQESRQLLCPCHQSVFDVLDKAQPVAGPAGRALPQLPLAVDHQGYLVADGELQGQVGPTNWRHP